MRSLAQARFIGIPVGRSRQCKTHAATPGLRLCRRRHAPASGQRIDGPVHETLELVMTGEKDGQVLDQPLICWCRVKEPNTVVGERLFSIDLRESLPLGRLKVGPKRPIHWRLMVVFQLVGEEHKPTAPANPNDDDVNAGSSIRAKIPLPFKPCQSSSPRPSETIWP